ncbi:MAG: radical SAM protein [Bacteroidetes bacterium]|nr:radical SAM protein [Bacteroidota bacterium]
MKIIDCKGREGLAIVYVAETEKGGLIEYVESLQPPHPREEKWVLIVSTLKGCPVSCRFCDCGGFYEGRLTKEEILFQIDDLITRRYPERKVSVNKFKIQFARMGEPSFNHHVLEVLEVLPRLYEATGLMPCLSTIAPAGTDYFFDKLLEIKKKAYAQRFQLQFSIHTTDLKLRDWLIPVKKWDFGRIAEYGNAFYDEGGRKITLNFAVADGHPVDPHVLLPYFSPEAFMIKITPVNPTYQAVMHQLSSDFTVERQDELADRLIRSGYEVILSIGESEEDQIGSNCGEYVSAHKRKSQAIVADR